MGEPGGQFLGAMQAELSASSDQITGVTAFNQGPCSSATGGKEWVSPGMRAVAQMGWAITLSNLRLAPQLVPHGSESKIYFYFYHSSREEIL